MLLDFYKYHIRVVIVLQNLEIFLIKMFYFQKNLRRVLVNNGPVLCIFILCSSVIVSHKIMIL